MEDMKEPRQPLLTGPSSRRNGPTRTSVCDAEHRSHLPTESITAAIVEIASTSNVQRRQSHFHISEYTHLCESTMAVTRNSPGKATRNRIERPHTRTSTEALLRCSHEMLAWTMALTRT
jgi:hypothetical protein